MIVKIKCPKCDAESTLSLITDSYQGPYKCWKCRGLFSIKLAAGKFKSCDSLSQEEFDKLLEIEALKAKLRRQE
jgi:hypothetical protein